MDPADRGLDSWDPWAEESQDPTPFVDRDEDQSAAERPRRGASDGASVSSSGAGTDGPPAPRAPRAPRRPRTAAATRTAAAPDATAPGAGEEEIPSAAPARRGASSFGQRSGKGTFGKRPPTGGGNSSFGRRGAPVPDSEGADEPVSLEGTSSAARAARKAERAAEAGSFGKRSPTGSFGKGGGAGSFGSRSGGSSSFGDGSSGFGRPGGKKKSRQRTWGVQLDAEVEEPVPAPAGDTAPETESPPAPARSGNRGRAGSFERPRRAEGEPAPEMEDPEQVARQLCLAALTGTAKTRQQLADMLHEREVPDEAAEAVLERFTEVGLIDDAAFAAMWIDSRQTGRGLSKRALAHELKAKGVDPEVAAVALEAVDPQAEWDTARALVAKKVPSMRRLDTVTATRRMVGMLARKGYGGGLAAIVVREALEADGAVEDAAAVADDAPPELGGSSEGTGLGAWSRRPVDETEVGEGLTLDGVARSRPVQRRSDPSGGRTS